MSRTRGPVLLLLFDKMVVGVELLQHVRHDHAASVSLIAEVGELMPLAAVANTQRKKGIGLDRQSLGFISFLPEELASNL